jgi:hypothetical protein
MLLYLILVGGPTFGILYQAWKAWDFSHWWRSAQATTLSSDYSDAERRVDNEPFAFLIPHPIKDGRTGRFTKVRVEYADASGHQHKTVITETVRRGNAVKAVRQIFYDVRDPSRVDQFGAFGAWIWLVIFGLALGIDLWRLWTVRW